MKKCTEPHHYPTSQHLATVARKNAFKGRNLRADLAQGGRPSAMIGSVLLRFLVEQHVCCVLPQLTDEFCG